MADATLTKAQALAEAMKQRWRNTLTTLYTLTEYFSDGSAPPFFYAQFYGYELDMWTPFNLNWADADSREAYNITYTGGSNTQLQPSLAGVYRITVHAHLDCDGQYEDPSMYIKKNGVTVDSTSIPDPTGEWGVLPLSMELDVAVEMTPSDYITLYFEDLEMQDYYDSSVCLTMEWLGYEFTYG